MALKEGTWIAADFGMPIFYIGKVTKVYAQSKSVDAMFLKKQFGNKYKESSSDDKGIENFAIEQVISTKADVQYINRGVYILNNYNEIEKRRLALKKSKKQKTK